MRGINEFVVGAKWDPAGSSAPAPPGGACRACAEGGAPAPRRSSGFRPSSPAAGVLRRNDTSFPTKLAAKLRTLHDVYLRALSDPGHPEHHWVKLLKYYQYLCRAVMSDPTYGLGADGNARGLLLYMATGIGKTRAAVGIAMALWDKRPVVAMLPRGLRQNFRDTVVQVVKALHPGAEGPELAALIAEAESHFAYVSMDAYNSAAQMARAGGPRKKGRGAATAALAEEMAAAGLDGKLLIVDEAHNFFRAIINSSAENANARRIYDMVMEARDLLLVFLTGTPAAKDPFELVPCFNMLAGAEILPTLYETFCSMYVDRERNAVRNRAKLANRLVGLVSHVSHGLPTEPARQGAEAARPANAPRAKGWFPEALPTLVRRVEMSPQQYRVYLLAREREEAEGGGGRGPEAAPPRLALPGAAKKATGTYFVGSRSASIFVPPPEWRGADVDAMPDEVFTEEASPKLADAARRILAAPGPVLVYSQFVEAALRPLGRYLQLLGVPPFKPDLGVDPRHPEGAGPPIVAVSAEGLGALWEARPALRASVEEHYRPPGGLEAPGTHYFATDPAGLFAAHALVSSAPGPETPPELAEAGAGRLWLREVFTRPDLRRRGYAKAVVRRALASNPTMGLALVADPGDEGAAALYRAHGFAGERVAQGASGPARLMLREAGAPGAGRGTYAIISGKVPEPVRAAIRAAEVLAANARGGVLRALLVSKTGAEGLDLKYLREVIIIEPYWDEARHDQVKGRGIRQGSHDELPEEDRDVQPVIYLAEANKGMWGLMPEAAREDQTIDETFYRRALARYGLNLDFRRLLAEVSIECGLFGYGACRVCVPTDAPLYHEDPALDLRLPDPCRAQVVSEVEATPLQLGGRTYYAAPDSAAPHGWAFYLYDESLGGHAPLDPADPAVAELLALVGGGAAGAAGAAGGGVPRDARRASGPRGSAARPRWCEKAIRGSKESPVAPPPGLEAAYGERFLPAERAAVSEVVSRGLAPLRDLPRLASALPSHLQYRQSIYPLRLAAHYGQRKLLLTEVDFLTDFARRGDTVVYAGSAPGTHIPYLASLFRPLQLKFELYDPRDFSFPAAAPEVLAAISTRNEYFTDETARGYSGRDDVLLVSDIRTGTDGSAHPTPEMVAGDMAMQAGWVRAAQPRAAMLKFRLDYDAPPEATTRYLAGEVRVQAWAPSTSTEVRLVSARPYLDATWRPRAHESQMYYYNVVLREWARFDHGVPLRLVPGLDHCPDCGQEVRIWSKFLEGRGEKATPAAVADLMNAASRSGSQPLSRPPHGLRPDMEPAARRALIKSECLRP